MKRRSDVLPRMIKKLADGAAMAFFSACVAPSIIGPDIMLKGDVPAVPILRARHLDFRRRMRRSVIKLLLKTASSHQVTQNKAVAVVNLFLA